MDVITAGDDARIRGNVSEPRRPRRQRERDVDSRARQETHDELGNERDALGLRHGFWLEALGLEA